MKLQSFIDILHSDSYKKAKDYYRKNGKNIFQDTKLLMALLDLEWSEKKNIMLIRLAGIISGEFMVRLYDKKKYFDNILPIYKYFQKYMYNDCSFIGVPFEEWEELQKEYIDLLKVFIQEGKLGNFEKDPLYQNFHNSTIGERESLVKKYPHLRADNGYG